MSSWDCPDSFLYRLSSTPQQLACRLLISRIRLQAPKSAWLGSRPRMQRSFQVAASSGSRVETFLVCVSLDAVELGSGFLDLQLMSFFRSNDSDVGVKTDPQLGLR